MSETITPENPEPLESEPLKSEFRPVRLVVFVCILIFALSRWISWYSEEVSMPRYCENPAQALSYLQKVINNEQPAGNEPRKPYLIAAKILYIIPQQSNEETEAYLNRPGTWGSSVPPAPASGPHKVHTRPCRPLSPQRNRTTGQNQEQVSSKDFTRLIKGQTGIPVRQATPVTISHTT